MVVSVMREHGSMCDAQFDNFPQRPPFTCVLGCLHTLSVTTDCFLHNVLCIYSILGIYDNSNTHAYGSLVINAINT